MADWKIALDRRLIDSDVEAWTTGMLWNEAASTRDPPAKPTFERWLRTAQASGRLRKVRSGLFLNVVGDKAVSPGAAAGYIKRAAVPSLSWVLEQDWILNNIGDVVTCVVPFTSGMPVPNLQAVRTEVGEFRFRALPPHIFELAQVDVVLWRDNRHAHPRATPEKAFCDWIYLAASPRSSLGPPPLDLDIDRLDLQRVRTLSKAMHTGPHVKAWLEAKRRHDADPDVADNLSSHFR